MNPYRILWIIGMIGSCSAYACHPSVPVIPPDGPTYDAGLPCSKVDQIDQSRIIRNPDGSALWLPCDQ